MSKVMLVEDDINLREIYAARLTAEGYEIVTASDGEEALSKAVSANPNLIVLDVMMPKISGFDVLDILRSTPETETTKVVMLSALSQEGDQQRGEKLGADKYLIKSQITLEDVVETVKEMLDNNESGSGSPAIVTTSNGRLPDENPQSNQNANADGQASQPQNQAPQSQPQQPQPQQAQPQQPSQRKQPQANQPQSPQTNQNTAADEIAHIDSQMEQNQSGANDPNTQQ